MGLRQWENDEVWDIQALACQGFQRAAWWCQPPAGRFSTLRSAIVPVPALGTAAPSDDQLQPMFAVKTRPLDRLNLWTTGAGIVKQEASLSPPRIRVQLRGCFECVPTILTTQDILMPSWSASDTVGWLFQFSGILCEQWEVWAAPWDPGGGPAVISMMAYFAVLIDHVGCCSATVQKGPWCL